MQWKVAVRVPAALATVLCVWAPPSDQRTNVHVREPSGCGEGALSVFAFLGAWTWWAMRKQQVLQLYRRLVRGMDEWE